MNVTYEKKDAMTFIGGGLSKVSGILGQGIRSQICETLADDEAGECCGKGNPGKWDRYVCDLCRF